MKYRKTILVLTGILLLIALACSKDSEDPENADPTASSYYVLELPDPLNTPGLVLLDMAAFQQTTEYTCGPACIVSLLQYYGQQGNEMQIADQMGTSPTAGTTQQQMVDWLVDHGFDVTWGECGTLEMIRENLASQVPTLIEWSDWGGHWVVAIGYDTRNTTDPMDDVIIFADPYDRHDDREDGIDWFNAERFYYMWYDALLFGEVKWRIYIRAVPL